MIVAGLTGSIGMGKSTVLAMFSDLGAATWNADDAVHRLYAEGGAGVAPLAASFPGAVADGVVDRKKLSSMVLGAPEKLSALEAIVHPLVAEDRAAFLDMTRTAGARAAILDIPLLFEGGGAAAFDAVIVVTAAAQTQRARVLARPGMTAQKFDAILARQTPDAEKRARADYIVNTGLSLDETRAEVEKIYTDLLEKFA